MFMRIEKRREELLKVLEARRRGRRGWVTLHAIGYRIGGSRMSIVEETLNNFVKEGKIVNWQFVGGVYQVLSDKTVTEIEWEVLTAIRKKYIK